MLRTRSLRLLVACLALALAPVSNVGADDHEEGQAQIEYRQKVMSAIGTNMGAIGDILKNRLDVPGAVANHAGQMADAAALIAPAFKKQLSAGATDAKPEIWADWAKFEEAIAGFEEAARFFLVSLEVEDLAQKQAGLLSEILVDGGWVIDQLREDTLRL